MHDGDAGGFALADELLRLQEGEFEIENEALLDRQPPEEQLAVVDAAVDAVAASPAAVADLGLFDTLCSCVKHLGSLRPEACHKLLDTLLSGTNSVLEEVAQAASGDADRLNELAELLQRDAFLLQWAVQQAEKHRAAFEAGSSGAGKRGGRAGTASAAAWSWPASVPAVLGTMARMLRAVPESMWTATSAARDTLVSRCVLRPVMLLQENEAYFKVPAIKMGMFKVVCLAVKLHGQAFNVQTSIVQSLQYYEHLAEPMAELLALMRLEFDYERLCDDVLRELAAKTFTAIDSKSPRSFARFLVRMAELNPRNVLRQISLLQTHLDSEAYPMRNAMVEVQGLMIRELAMEEDALGEAPADADGEERSMRQKQLDGFFDRLLERFLDLTTFVRTKVIHVCAGLCDLPAKFPTQRMRIAALAVQALEDKGSNVRRNAIALLTKLVLTHPYGLMHGGELEADAWQARLDAARAELAEMEKQLELPEKEALGANAEASGVDASRDDASEADASSAEGSAADRKPRRSELDLEALAARQQTMTHEDNEHLVKLRLTCRYYEDALAFVHLLERAIPTLTQLLASTNKPEVLESMDFFRIAHEYKIRGAQDGIRAMVHLIWAKDNALVMEDGSQLKGIRSRLIEVYRALYFDPLPGLSRTENTSRIARNMIERTFDASLAELTSLEQMLGIMQGEDLVHPDVIHTLWDVYATGRPIARAQRRGAIMVLGMLATADREIVASQVDVLLRIGLGPLGARDLTLAKYTCVALQRVAGSTKKVKGALTDQSVRYPMTHPMFARLRAAVQLCSTQRSEWFSLAEHALQAIYLLGEQPDALCTEILHELTVGVFGERRTPDGGEAAPSAQDAFHVAQLLFVVGHVALKQLVYLELVEREFKRRKAVHDAAQAKEEGKRSSELDQVAGNAEDDIGEMIASIRERELLFGPRSLLALYGPLVTHICTNARTYPDEHVRRAAALTLGKLMCVSSAFCEEHLPLLLHVLKTSQDAVVRSNVVIGLGDVAVCFGTLVDENSGRLYAGLGDPDLGVKKNTLMVLTHLILNGMIKVKGQLGELAKCLEDEEPRVSDLAKLFFSELATKENAVYNNLPDIISHLSIGEHAVEEEVFINTMKFIFTFIDKERQAENVIEKLCQRFRLTTEERQWRDIAFCLSLLPYRSERSIKKLVDGLPFYQDKLYHPEVYKRFTEILAKIRSGKSGGQAKAGETDLREFEDTLAQASAQGRNDHEAEDQTQAQVAKAERRRAREQPAAARRTAQPTRRSARSRAS